MTDDKMAMSQWKQRLEWYINKPMIAGKHQKLGRGKKDSALQISEGT